MESVILELEGRLGCYRVVASESFTIPPRSEIVAYCEVCVPPGNIFSSGLGNVEPRHHFLDSNIGQNIGTKQQQGTSEVYESICRCKYDLQRHVCREFGSGIAGI